MLGYIFKVLYVYQFVILGEFCWNESIDDQAPFFLRWGLNDHSIEPSISQFLQLNLCSLQIIVNIVQHEASQ